MSSAASLKAYVKMMPTERRAVSALALVLALRMFGLFVLLPVLALYASDLPGGTPLLAGLAVGAFGITQALLQVPAGMLSDRIGRKAVILIGLAVFAAGSLIAANADTIVGLLCGRVLQGAGAISAAATAFVADLTRAEVRTRAMAIVGIAIGSTFMLALALGAWLAARIGVPGLFFLGAGLGLVAAAIIVGGPGQWRPPPSRGVFRLRDALARRLLSLHAGIFILHFILTATFVAVPFLLRDQLGVVPALHTRTYLLAMVLSLAAAVPLIVAVERYVKPMAVFLLSVVLLAAGQTGLVLAASPLTVLLALALFFAGFNFLEARLPAQVSQVAGARSRGAAMGFYATAQYLGSFAGGLGGGLLLGADGPDGVFYAGIVLALCWSAAVAVAILKPGPGVEAHGEQDGVEPG